MVRFKIPNETSYRICRLNVGVVFIKKKTFSGRNISLHVWAITSYWIVWTLSTVFRPTSIKLFPRRTRASFWLTTWNCNKQLLANLIKQLLDNVIKQLLGNLIKQLLDFLIKKLLANLIKQLCSILILVLFLVLLLGILCIGELGEFLKGPDLTYYNLYRVLV